MVQEGEVDLKDLTVADSVHAEEPLAESIITSSINTEEEASINNTDTSIVKSQIPYASMSLATSNNIAEDTLPTITEPIYGLMLTPPESPAPAPRRSDDGNGVSYILTGLFIMALIVALRFRNNIKYVATMFQNLVEVRTRHNMFDDTVRETSLIVLLNILWCACVGIICYSVYSHFHPLGEVGNVRALGMLWGMALASVYALFMWCAYTSVGWVFSDRSHSALWVKGFLASQALMAPALFIIALLAICRQAIVVDVGFVAAGVFIAAKLMFIWKGYRIFFNQISSWVLFLCYLCSLEIVPLILSYRCALLLGEVL